jgi:hypothetical protein
MEVGRRRFLRHSAAEERFVEVAPWADDDDFPAVARGFVYGTLLSIAFWLLIGALVYRAAF